MEAVRYHQLLMELDLLGAVVILLSIVDVLFSLRIAGLIVIAAEEAVREDLTIQLFQMVQATLLILGVGTTFMIFPLMLFMPKVVIDQVPLSTIGL